MASTSNFVAADGKQRLDLPLGYRFHPSDAQVIHYLKQKISSEELPVDIIPTIPNLYGLGPDEIPLGEYRYEMEHESDEFWVTRQWFFFTTRSEEEGHISTKDGYWHSTESPTPVEDHTTIGFKQAIDFYRGIFPDGNKSNWTVYEYRLNPDVHDTKYKVQKFVACRILRKEERYGDNI